MAIVREQPKTRNLASLSYEADGDLTNLQYCAVSPSSAATGKMQVKAPTGQGVLTVGILQTYTATDALQAEIITSDISKAIGDSTFNSGVELTVAGTDGKLEAASSGDYVIAISEEACIEADQVVTVRVVSPYQKN